MYIYSDKQNNEIMNFNERLGRHYIMQEEIFLKKGFLFTTHLLTINYYSTITIAKMY